MRISFTGVIESNRTVEELLEQSAAAYQAGRFEVCILAAQSAIVLNPDSAIAWSNICAAFNSLGQFEQGRTAGEQALKWDPTLVIAANNLEWSNRGLDSNRLLELDRRVAVVKTGETDFHRWGDLKKLPCWMG